MNNEMKDNNASNTDNAQNTNTTANQANQANQAHQGGVVSIDTAKAKEFITSGIRGHVRKFFPPLVSIMFILSLIVVFIAAISMGSIVGYRSSFNFMTFLTVLLGGWASTILAFGIVYLLMDIRDAVEKKS